MHQQVLIPWPHILAVLAKRSASMHKQWGLPLAQGDKTKLIAALSEEQREAIRAALRTLFEAALSFSEDCQDDKRKD
jgi:hypothetical protein